MQEGSRRIAPVAVALVLVWFASSIVVGYRLGLLTGRTAPGVTFLGASVALLSPEDARGKMEERLAEVRDTPVELYRGAATFKCSLKDLGYELDGNLMLDRILHFGSTGSLLSRLADRIASRREGYTVPLSGASTLERTVFLEDLNRAVGRPVRNAYWQISWTAGDSVKRGSTGRVVDYAALEGRVTRALLRNVRYRKPSIRVEVPLRTELPRVSTADIRGMQVLSTSTTKFDVAVTNRVYNIRLAVDKLLGQAIQPQATWSLNEAVGPREEKQGFKEAMVITEGKFVKGIGGGVSQVTTTTFDAALMANLKVPEHYSHTIPITYVPFGLDGTAVYGQKDLKIYNNTGALLSIAAAVSGDEMRVKFYGFRAEPISVELAVRIVEKYEPKVTTVPDSGLRTGYQVTEQEAVPGYRIAIDRTVRDASGKVTNVDVAATGWYRAIEGIVHVGTNPTGTIPDSAPVPPTAVATPVSPSIEQPAKPATASTRRSFTTLVDSLIDQLQGDQPAH